MPKKIRAADLPNFDPAEYLKDEEDMAAYLTAILEENDPALLAAALGDIARARGSRLSPPEKSAVAVRLLS
jgi:probable addiction module antidote protein